LKVRLGTHIGSFDKRRLDARSAVPRLLGAGKGNCYAMVETFFKTLKSELIWRTIFQTGTEAKLTIGRPE
jgi:hypothetical protein